MTFSHRLNRRFLPPTAQDEHVTYVGEEMYAGTLYIKYEKLGVLQMCTHRDFEAMYEELPKSYTVREYRFPKNGERYLGKETGTVYVADHDYDSIKYWVIVEEEQ